MGFERGNIVVQSKIMATEKSNVEVTLTVLQKQLKLSADQVKEDGVMKEKYKKEEESRQNWEGKWGFMNHSKKLWMEEAQRRGFPTSLFESKNVKDNTICSAWLESKLENVKLQESKKISKLSSGVIGWRSSVPENDYNRFVGPLYESFKLSLKIPRTADEPELKHQRVLFLG